MNYRKPSVHVASTPSPRFEQRYTSHTLPSEQNLSLDQTAPFLGLESIPRRQSHVPPPRHLSTGDVPPVPSIVVSESENSTAQLEPAPQLTTRAATNLRESIVKLELLIREAARLAEVAAQPETAIEMGGKRAQVHKPAKNLTGMIGPLDASRRLSSVMSTRSPSVGVIHMARSRSPEPRVRTAATLPTTKADKLSSLSSPFASLTVDDARRRSSAIPPEARKEIDVCSTIPVAEGSNDIARNNQDHIALIDNDPPLSTVEHQPYDWAYAERNPSLREQAVDNLPTEHPQFSVPHKLPMVRRETIGAPPQLQINGFDMDDMEEPAPEDSYALHVPRLNHERHFSSMFGIRSRETSVNLNHAEAGTEHPKIDLHRKSYVDVYNKGENFDVHDTCHHATVARNWPSSRKRFAAVVACVNTGCIGLLLGIYAGEVPAIQYVIADPGHYAILGNVVMYLGLAVSVLVFWPLPLLHGRKPYVIAAQLVALVLQLPEGLAVANWRDPDTPLYRALILVARGLSGAFLGLADMNHKATLLDVFGASLQSQDTFSDTYADYDVRKHGGGMGLWLGVIAWSTVGPISIGFMVGASIIQNGASVSWGF